MPYKNESMLMGDAANDTSTQLCFSPPEGPFGRGNQVTGTIGAGDEDWIAIKLTEGNEYTITVGGDTVDGRLNDSVLKLMDGKGGLISMNDDTDAAKGMLGSTLKFTPEAGSGTQVYFISVSGYTGNPGANNTGGYTVNVEEVAVLPAGEGADIMATSDNDHKLTGTDDSESIAGMGGNDTLIGLGGDDTLSGGGGNDLLNGGPGADTLKGGAGEMDTISYDYSPAGVTINLGDGTARGGDADGDTIVDMGDDRIENVRGSMHDDILIGNTSKNSLWGLGGNDELDGGRRDDKLFGGDGDDILDGGAGEDMLEGGYGADMLTGGEDSDTASYSMSMMGVTVRLHSGQAMGGDAEGDMWNLSETVEYQDGDEEMQEATVADIENLTGSGNDDILAGDLRDNVIMGGGGDDKIYGGPNPADADKEGNSRLTNADTLHGGGGNDMLFGGVGADTLKGDAGNDMLNGGSGADRLYGGYGSDMIYADTMDTVINGWVEDPPEDPDNAGTDLTEAQEDPMAVDTVSFARLEDETVGNTGAGGATAVIWQLATEAPNVENVIGSQGNDNIAGTAGKNVIEGGEGGDILDGGDEEDTLSYESSDDWIRVTLNDSGAATASRGHASGDQASNFENVRGSAYDDDITGNNVANKLWGGAGDDDLDGEEENDTLEGGAGADKLDGGFTARTATGQETWNAEMNTLSYASSDAGVTVNLMTSSASGGHATDDEIVTYEELAPTDDDPNNEIDVATFVNVTGSMHDDHLTGNHHDNELNGGAGDDTLRGGASDAGDRSTAAIIRGDVLVGGPGADMLDGGEDMGEKDDMIPGVDLNGDGDFDDTVDGVAETAPVAASVDWAVYKHAMEGVMIDLSTNRGTGGEAMGDTLMNIELVWGSEKDDTFISGPGGDIIEGDGGSDTVSYEASSLGVTVDLSDDAHNRTVVADVTTDPDNPVFTADTNPAGVTTHLTATGVPAILAGTGDTPLVEDEDDNPNTNGARGDKLGSIENLTGSAHDDDLTGDENPNVLKGMGGDDDLDGGTGNDMLYGGMGMDTLTGGDGVDKLDGGAGGDTLSGGGGTDTLIGGAGSDDLSGGADGDTFVFSTADAGDSDAILDYADGDMIDLRAFGLTADQVKGAITLRGNATDGAYIVINLTEYGGGRITVDNITDLDTLDIETDGGTGDTADAIDTLSVARDLNGNGVFTDTLSEVDDGVDYNNDGDMEDTGITEAGIFIL